MAAEVIIRGGTVVTVDQDRQVVVGDVVCRDGEIVSVGTDATPRETDYQIIDATGCIVMPGLVQSHVHTCQTLARGRGDGLELLDWLRQVVWPYEGALSKEDVAAASRLACVELLRGGTTAILDMGTVHHTDEVFAAARDAGIRATIGKAMMDDDDPTIPSGLRESTADSVAESERLLSAWHGRSNGRLRYAFAPRFALSCTDELLREVAEKARHRGVLIHTHSSESKGEIAEVKRSRGLPNIEYLDSVGLTGPDVGLAHCVWLSDKEIEIMVRTKTNLLHCPGSNLKLASGIAKIPELAERGVAISLGADGAPCNNNLDGFLEMRLAALIHKPRCGPLSMAAPLVVEMATLGGARALGLAEQIGSIENGKRADIIVVELGGAHVVPTRDPYSAIVYGCRSTDVRDVIVDGQVVVSNRQLLTMDSAHIVATARERADGVFGRI